MRAPPSADDRPPYRAALLAALAVLALYAATLGPTVVMWDTGEYMATSYVLGVPHPPGNPLFVLLGRLMMVAPLGRLAPATKVNLLAALCSAAAAGFWFLVTERVLHGWVQARWVRLAGAGAASIVGATAYTVWSQSVVNEKVYTVALAGLALAAWLVVRWLDAPDGAGADRRLVLVWYVLGLGYAVHMAGLLAAPAAAVAVLARRPRTLLRGRLVAACAAALLLGLTPFLAEPVRAAFDPAVNEGQVTACVGAPRPGCTFSGETLDRWRDHLARKQFGGHTVVVRQAPFAAQLGMFWEYFRWQWVRDLYDRHPVLQLLAALAFLALGAAGGWVHWRRDRRTFWLVGPLVLTLTLVLVFYLNFRYGYSQWLGMGAPGDIRPEVRDRDYFYLWTFSAWGLWVAVGLVALWERAARAIAGGLGAAPASSGAPRHGIATVPPPPRAWALSAPVLLVALVPLAANLGVASHRGDTFTRSFAHDLLSSVEPDGVLITAGDDDTFPLWYAQDVEHFRRDVTVACTCLLPLDWYVDQLIRRPAPSYDAARGPAIYRGLAAPTPGAPLLHLSPREADTIPDWIEVREPARFAAGPIAARIEPQVLTRDQLVVLQMIKDTFPTRPIYFARSTGAYANRLGLAPYLVTQGLARKLVADPRTAGDTVLLPNDGWLDVSRSSALWETVFETPRDALHLPRWTDRASVGMPLLYADLGASIAQALEHGGRSDAAARVRGDVERLLTALRLAPLLGVRPGDLMD